jgi:hypothetical protein
MKFRKILTGIGLVAFGFGGIKFAAAHGWAPEATSFSCRLSEQSHSTIAVISGPTATSTCAKLVTSKKYVEFSGTLHGLAFCKLDIGGNRWLFYSG